LFQVERTDFVAENFRQMILLVHMNRVGLYQVAINTSEKTKLNSSVPVNNLPTGLLQFTLFTSDWIPVAERVIFINNHSHEFDVKLSTPLINVEKKGKNAFEILVPDTLFTNMSIAITDAAVTMPAQHTIFSDILLSSEIKGKVYNPAYYLSNNSDSTAAHLDLVMLTNGWRRFDWDKIKAGIAPKNEHPIETAYMKLKGKVPGMKNNNKPVQLNMIIVGKDSSRQFISVPVEKNGNFEYPTVFFDTAKVFFSFNNNKSLNDKTGIGINNGLLHRSPKNIQLDDAVAYTWNDGLAKQKLDVLLEQQELLRKKMAETTLSEVIVTTRVKTKEEKLDEKYTSGFFKDNPARKAYVLDLSDPATMTSATSVMEYLQSKVPGLTTNGGLSWRGHLTETYLNEMRVDLQTIQDIPLINIAMIKAFPPIFMFATGGGRGGAIVVYTRSGVDFAPSEMKGLSNVILSGYTKFKEFYHPSYEPAAEEYSKTDNRTTLYWNPGLFTNNVQQNMRIEFFNNDFTKAFNVVLEGINAAGKMTRIERTVKSKCKS
jgi:hypothetical protein